MPLHADHVALDVFLRGSRTYVQGTQIIARIAHRLAEPNAHLVRATFASITDNLVTASPIPVGSTASDEAADAPLGAVFFRASGEDRGFHFFDAGTPAPRYDRSTNVTVNLAGKNSRSSARYEFAGATSLESSLNVIVQSVKAMHDDLNDRVFDIWFTGIRGVALPVSPTDDQGRGFIDCAIARVQQAGEQHQTLVKVRLLDQSECEIRSGVVTFAFKSDEAVNVD